MDISRSGVTEEPVDSDQGTDVDKVDCAAHKMDIESPSSDELEQLGNNTSSDTESETDLNSHSYTIQKGDATQRFKTAERADSASPSNLSGSPTPERDKNDNAVNDENKEPLEKKPRKDRIKELSTPEKRLSGDASRFMDLNLSGSRPGSAASSAKSGSGREKGDDSKKLYMIWSGRVDPNKKEKDREREERIKQTQQRIAEERQRKLDDMREQQRIAQENREKQLEARRRKIEDLKRREEERRRTVEERRRQQEETDRAKKEAILSKAKERLTRYEQWKSTGRKGGRRHMLGFGSRAPREVCLPLDRRSSSQSTLRRSPNSSDYDSYFHRRAVSASSVVRRHCCIDINKLTQGTGAPPGGSPPSKHLSVSTSVLYHKRSPQFSSTGALNTSPGLAGSRSGAESLMASSAPPTRHKSSVNLGTTGQSPVKMRERSSPRKPRPSSVATSMPSFVQVDGGTPKSSRSKSTDRHVRDRSTGKPPTPGRKVDKTDSQDDVHKAATLPRPYERRKIEERRQEVKKKLEDKKDEESKPPVRLTKSFIERMAAPKHPSPEKKETAKEPTPVRAKPLKKDRMKESPAKSALKTPKDKVVDKDTSSETRSETDRSEGSETQSMSPAPEHDEKKDDGKEQIDKLETIQTGEPSADASLEEREPRVKIWEPELERSSKAKPDHRQRSPEPKPDHRQRSPEPRVAFKDDVKTVAKTDKEREMEEYKAKLAERRRLAREKAEREAEIERLRQEEAQRQEEERERLEEERQRREEEEALRLAEEARKLEEERLQRAIEAEEKRRKEEAERQERERIEREESERRAREEAERLERERLERAKREEEERLERKKRLEMIMKRVKTDSPGSTPEKRTESPPRVVLRSSGSRGSLQQSSGPSSLVSSEDEKGDDSEREDKDKSDSEDTPKFKSPLLQKLTEQKSQNGDSGTPKFKSPLLQSLIGKTKIGARLSSSTTRLDEKSDDKGDIKMTHSDIALSKHDVTDDKGEEKYSISDTNGQVVDGYDSNEDVVKKDESDIATRGPDSHVVQHTVIDTSEASDTDKHIIDSGVGEISPSSDTDSKDTQQTHVIPDATADSAVSLSYNGVASHNGDIHIEPKERTETKELVDSSISMRTVDSITSSQSDSFGGSLFEPQTLTTSQNSEPSQFEEIIDLTVSNKTLKSQQLQDRLINHSQDLLNLNSLDNCMSGVDDTSMVPGKPIIAFEENATQRQDVTDLLS